MARPFPRDQNHQEAGDLTWDVRLGLGPPHLAQTRVSALMPHLYAC
jgi:hypothetical protein